MSVTAAELLFHQYSGSRFVGKIISHEYEDMLNETVARAQRQMTTLRESGVTPVVVPKMLYLRQCSGNFSADGKHMAVITEDVYKLSLCEKLYSLVRIPPRPGGGGGGGRASWMQKVLTPVRSLMRLVALSAPAKMVLQREVFSA